MTKQITLRHPSGVKEQKRHPNDVVTYTCKNKKGERGKEFSFSGSYSCHYLKSKMY